MEDVLLQTLCRARALQLFYHYCHNLTSGVSFHADHEFFGSSYPALEDSYDALAEQFISIFSNSKFATKQINSIVCIHLERFNFETLSAEEMYQLALSEEKQWQKYLSNCNKHASLGLSNLLQGMSTESDVRLYKIRQRLKRSS